MFLGASRRVKASLTSQGLFGPYHTGYSVGAVSQGVKGSNRGLQYSIFSWPYYTDFGVGGGQSRCQTVVSNTAHMLGLLILVFMQGAVSQGVFDASRARLTLTYQFNIPVLVSVRSFKR